jgi:hypothetical protein
MRVHSEPQQFKIFADGNADIRRVELLVGFSNEMVKRAGSRRARELTDRITTDLFALSKTRHQVGEPESPVQR